MDGLRAVAVIPVILYHAGVSAVPGGFLGVDVFFVISGYLITNLLLEDLEKGRFSLLDFYERRARRILPVLVLVMLCCIPFAWMWMLPWQLEDFGQSLVAVALFVSNILFWKETDYFAAEVALKPLLHTWSLAVEEQYYLLFPPVLLLLWSWGQRRMFWIVAALATASFLLCEFASHRSPAANFYLAPTRAWELLAGSLCAFAASRGQRSSEALSLLGLALIAAAFLTLGSAMRFPSALSLVPVVGTALVILFARPGTLVARLLSARILVGLGLVSYSAYLWHQPVFAFARLRLGGEPGAAEMSALTLLSLLLACLSWRFVEQPFRGKAYLLPSRPKVFGTALAAGAGVLGLGAFLVAGEGLAWRYPPEDRALASLDRDAATAYVEGRFNAMRLQPFPDNGKPNVLIVGDSFAQDLVNAVWEAGLAGRSNVSTHYIPAICGNLLLHRSFDEFIAPLDRDHCYRVPRYDHPALSGLLARADHVILASAWTDWQAATISESVSNIAALTDARIVVLGRKDFGQIDLAKLIALPEQARIGVRNEVRLSHREVNEAMRAALGPSLIDLQATLCHSRESCPVLTADGRLISYDGLHLTRDGAAWMGEALGRDSPELRKALGFDGETVGALKPQDLASERGWSRIGR